MKTERIKRTSEYDNTGVIFDGISIQFSASIGEKTEWRTDEDGYPVLAYDYEIIYGKEWDAPSDKEILMALGVLEEIKKELMSKLSEYMGDAK